MYVHFASKIISFTLECVRFVEEKPIIEAFIRFPLDIVAINKTPSYRGATSAAATAAPAVETEGR
jgi:hypothetical protein